MSWPCYAIKSVRLGDWEPTESGGRRRQMFYTMPDGREVTLGDLKPGAMWHSSQQPNYWGKNAGPLVLLPRRLIWCMAEPGTDECQWAITGDIPNVTAHPSINFVGLYHGWVQKGVVTDDCDGRRFDEMGNLIQ